MRAEAASFYSRLVRLEGDTGAKIGGVIVYVSIPDWFD